MHIDELQLLYPSMDLTIFKERPKSDVDLIERYMPSKLWRLNNLYTIVDKSGDRIPFVMNRSQLRVYAESLKHPRLLILKSRQQGISTFWLISYFDDALFIPDTTVGLMSQGKAESVTLLQRVKLAWDELDGSVKAFLGLSLDKNNSEEFAFSNGSTIYIRTSFRSATLQRLHISEYGKIANKYPEKARETKTGTLQAISAGNTVAIESTAEGDNDFKEMWDCTVGMSDSSRSPKDFKPVFLSWLDDPDCVTPVPQDITAERHQYFKGIEQATGLTLTDQQKWFWVAQYRELAGDIYQEYPATPDEAFTASRDGAFWATQFRDEVMRRGRVVDGLYDQNLDVYVACDLGMNDDSVLVFFQRWYSPSTRQWEWRIIDEYVNSGEGLSHYVNVMLDKPYHIADVLLPHDVRVRELSTGQSRLHRLRELGVKRTRVLPRIAVSNGIEAVRRILPFLWVDARCGYLMACMKNYSKEWDDKLRVWKDRPLHNQYSHGADAIRYMAIGGATIGSQEMGSLAKSVVVKRVRSRVIDGLAL